MIELPGLKLLRLRRLEGQRKKNSQLVRESLSSSEKKSSGTT